MPHTCILTNNSIQILQGFSYKILLKLREIFSHQIIFICLIVLLNWTISANRKKYNDIYTFYTLSGNFFSLNIDDFGTN